MTKNSTDVLVVGAGPTGLTAAILLREWGVAVRIVDAAPVPFPGSRGKGLQPRSLEVLDQFGLASRLTALGRFRMRLRRYAGPHDRIGAEVDLHPDGEPTPDTPWARSLLLPQWRTEEVLRERLAELDVPIEWNTELTELGDPDDDGVIATVGDDRVRAAYVIGADGGGSTTRRLLDIPFLGQTHEDVRLLLADVRLDGLDRDAWHIWNSESAPFLGLCPLPSADTYQLQMSIDADAELSDPTADTVREAVHETVPGVRVRAVSWVSRWRLNVRMVERYRVSRVFLAGDAAHVHSPAGGQGMNTGIQDAVNLGWKLGAVFSGTDPALLDSYESERLPVAAQVLGLANQLSGRHLGQRGEEGKQALQLGVTYRGGPLAPAVQTVGPQPGDRAPDAPLHTADGQVVRLFELLRGPEWTVLAFGVGSVPRKYFGDMRLVEVGKDVFDVDGHLAQAYQPAEGEVLTIRPDRHLGLRGKPGEVAQWLRSLAGASTTERT